MSPFPWQRGLSLLLALLLLAVLAGCGPRLGTVSGEVKFKGQPVANAVIKIQSQTGKKVVAQGTVADGKFTVGGVPVGPAKISIQQVAPPPPPKDKDKGKGKGTPKTATPPPPTIPAKYQQFDSSGLECTVTAGEQTIPTIELQP